MKNSVPPSIPAELLVLQQAFAEELPQRIDAISQSWQAFRGQLHDEYLGDELYRKVHNLSGAGGTFGVIPVSHASHELELAIKALRSDHSTNVIDRSENVQKLMDRLQDIAGSWQPSQIPYMPQTKKNQQNFTRQFNNLIYLVDDDATLGIMLSDLLKKDGYEPIYFRSTTEFQERWATLEPPGAIVMDMVFQEGAIAGAETIQALRDKWGFPPPVIFVSVRNDFESRFAAVKAGANRYFSKPLDYDNLRQTLDGLTGRLILNPYRILLIDDDPSVLEFHSSLLRDQGVEVETLTDPRKALTVIADFKPELVVLDVYMPVCSGLELATIIRQDDNFAQMPIVFLSAELDFGKHLAALDLGGDEFLTKLIEPEHFVVAITARLKKARWVNRVNGQLHEVLKQSEYQRIALDLHGVVSITDTDGNIIHVNEKFCEVTGYSRDELTGRPNPMLMADSGSDGSHSEMWAIIESGNIWNDLFSRKTKSGSDYWLDCTIVPFLDENGKPYQYVSVGTDITPMKKIQADLVFAMKEVEQANEAKSQFLANMSHELRTPLNAILGFAEIMQMDSDKPLSEKQLDCAKKIESAGDHLLKLINEILDLSAVESGKVNIKKEPLLLEAIVEECRQLIAPSLFAYQVTLDYDTEQFLGKSVQADAMRLKQVLLNLMSNACKYNRVKGNIYLDCQPTTDGYLRISVKDTGNGIPLDKQSELFKPFSRLGAESSSIEGTGIGLVYCKKLIALMNGRIGFESQAGQGSTFWIEIPQAASPAR